MFFAVPVLAALFGSQLVAAGGFTRSCSCNIITCQGKNIGDYNNCADLACQCGTGNGGETRATDLILDAFIGNSCGQLSRTGGSTRSCRNQELLQGGTLLHAQCVDCQGRESWSIINIDNFITNRGGQLVVD